MSASNPPSQSEYVTLVSGDGFEFVIPRSTACVSGTIRRMLEPSSRFSESVTGRCVLENISGIVLEKCRFIAVGWLGFTNNATRWLYASINLEE
ncbi:hypothetical protein CBS76997_9832 [Aspergillus niger]|nr:hypothetical protein CBS13152_9035 [Aspergillus niger]KAI2965391.1 hypothetical protein CBS147323_5898 [Aspergillus niger]KAI3021142.1 hypothetical protein CBS147347_8049 [Aspergillus niger]KAI3036600.1 hypothetical protein CBS76997_9832 [Aspergillus niger]KAI3064491.1 hypothetical protein CBS147353_8661 [Aspergillus niger]